MFANLEEIFLEAENIYSSSIDLTAFKNLKKIDVQLNPSEKFASLLSGTEIYEPSSLLVFTEEQLKTVSFTIHLDSFVSHDLDYLVKNFGVTYPFRAMQKVKFKVGILKITEKYDQSYINGKLPKSQIKKLKAGPFVYKL